MFYVSDKKVENGNILYGVTDTDTGVTEYSDIAKIRKAVKLGIKIEGVGGGRITVVRGNVAVTPLIDRVKESIGQMIYGWSYENCEDLARKGGFVRKIKPLQDDPNAYHALVMERLFPSSIEDVINQAVEYSNILQSVPVNDQNTVIDTLKNNMCLILQLGSKGNLTVFTGTASIDVMDSLYGKMYIDTFLLTQRLYGYTYGINRIRPNSTPKNPKSNLRTVFSGSLRFRESGTHHDSIEKQLSSPTYTVNLATILGCFIITSPGSSIKYNVINEYDAAPRKELYNFDKDLWEDVKDCVLTGVNRFRNKDLFLQYVDTEHLVKAIDYNIPINRFNKDFEYMKKLRSQGGTIV